VRLVSREWRDCHDALVTRLTVTCTTNDEGMWLLVRRFPAVVSLAMKHSGRLLTDEGLKAVSSLIGLTSLDISHCELVTDEGLKAVSTLTGLTFLKLRYCDKVTAEGLKAVSSLTGLKSLDLCSCSTSKAGRDALKAAIPGLTIRL
jgi:hypothetical protein